MNKDEQLRLLGLKIRALRESTGMTQDQMANEIGFARSYYSGVERGVRNISAANLIRLAISMKVEVGELFPNISDLS